MATGTNADLRKLWGSRPRRQRRPGREPAKNFLMIMKDGRIYKNSRRRV
jgi:hypothetical protein